MPKSTPNDKPQECLLHNNASKKIKQKCINILSHDRILQRLTKSKQFHFQINSFLAKTHIMTDIELTHENDSQTFRRSSIRWADLDPVEHKYILLGKNNSSICIYDISKSSYTKSISEIGHISRSNRHAHELLVSCVQWFPLDSGLFTSSSNADKLLKIWDPNTLKLVDQFELASNIQHHHMSHVASRHSLIAAALNNGEVNLCDLRTGSSTHSLHGHLGPVNSVQWSKHNQYILSSGGEKTIRIWDVRSGRSCLKIINLSVSNRVSKEPKRRHYITHSSKISSLCYTYDGLWLISYSFDGRICVWDAAKGTLHKKKRIGFRKSMGYPNLSIKLGITHNLYPDLIFVPDYYKVYVVEMTSGEIINVLDPQFSGVLGAVYNPHSRDLYTYGVDMNFIVWTPDMLASKLVDNDSDKKLKLTSNTWSSDED